MEQTVFLLFPLLIARTSSLLRHGSGVLDFLLSCLHSVSSEFPEISAWNSGFGLDWLVNLT